MNVFPQSRERQNSRLGCSALEVIASEMNDLNVMATPCQGKRKGKPCIGRNAHGKVPLMARLSDVHGINGVCTHMLNNSLYEHGDLQSCGLC